MGSSHSSVGSPVRDCNIPPKLQKNENYPFPEPLYPSFTSVDEKPPASRRSTTISFRVLVPKEFVNGITKIYVRGNITPLSWKASTVELVSSPFQPELFTGKATFLNNAIKNNRLEYKYFVDGSSKRYEEGSNRIVSSRLDNERYDIWRPRYQNYQNGKNNNFPRFMHPLWTDLTTKKISVSSWIQSYVQMILYLKKEKTISPNDVKSWCDMVVNGAGHILHPVFILCIVLIKGSFPSEVKVKKSFFYNRTANTDPLIHILSQDFYWDGSLTSSTEKQENFASSLDKTSHLFLCRGICALVTENYENNSYEWLYLASFYSILVRLDERFRNTSQAFFKFSPTFTAEKPFADVIKKLNFLSNPSNVNEDYPILRAAIRAAPTAKSLQTLATVLPEHEDLSLVLSHELKQKIIQFISARDRYGFEQLANEVNILLRSLPGTGAYEITSMCLKNKYYIQSGHKNFKKLITTTTERILSQCAENSATLLNRLGEQSKEYLINYYRISKHVTTVDMFTAFSELFVSETLEKLYQFFLQALRIILSEKNDKTIIIHSLPKISSSYGMYGEYHEQVYSEFKLRCIKAVPSFVSSIQSQRELLNSLKSIKGAAEGIKFAILEVLLENINNQSCTVESLLQSYETWLMVFNFIPNNSQQKIASVESVNAQITQKTRNYLLAAKGCIESISQRFKNRMVTINELRMIQSTCNCYRGQLPSNIDNSAFVKLQNAVSVTPINRNILCEHLEQVKQYEEQFNALKIYLEIFCNPRQLVVDRIDEIVALTIELRKQWDSLVLNDIKKHFKILPKVPEHFAERHTSDLFITIWKCESDHLHPDPPDVIDDIPVPDVIDDIDIDEIPDDNIELQAITITSEKRFIWSFHEIEESLVPRVNKSWDILFNAIDEQTMSFPELAKYFTSFNDSQLRKEVNVLASSLPNKSRASNWKRERLKSLSNFKVLEGNRKNVIHLLQLVTTLKTLFTGSLHQDPLFIDLQKCNEEFQEQWDQQTLGKSKEFFILIQKIFKSNFTLNHSQYLNEFSLASSTTDVINWLLEQSNTTRLNDLISITKQNTDDTIALNGIACLVATRTRLSKILYREKAFVSIREFLDVFVSEEITEEQIKQLQTTRDQFSLLKQTFEQKTRNEFMQACFTLKQVMENGEYSWLPSHSSSLLTLKYDNSGNVSFFSLDELLDLRNKLLLGEPPEKIDGINIKSLVLSFVVQLKEILAYHQLIEELQVAGHLSYLRYSGTINCSIGIKELEEQTNFLRNQLNSWCGVVHDLRDNYYFVNYYTISHLIALLDNLNEYTSSGNESSKKEIFNYLRFIDSNLSLSELDIMLINWIPDVETILPKKKLNKLAKFLKNSFEPRKILSRNFCDEIFLPGSQFVFEASPCRAYVTVTPCDRMLDVIITLFAQAGRLAEADEILFCDPLTTVEEIELIIRRWITAGKYNREGRLYCIANIHRLSYTIQSKTARLLLYYMRTELARSTIASIVLISGPSTNQHLVSALNHVKLAVGRIEDFAMQKIYKQIVDAFSHHTNVLWSSIAGSGKTNHILKYVAETEKRYCHLSITNSISADELISRIPDTSNCDPIVFHIDIGPTAGDENLNSMLFQLIVLGRLFDSHTGKFFVKRDCDTFFIELANSFKEQVRSKLSLCRLLPNREMIVSRETFDLNEYSPLLHDATNPLLLKYTSRKSFERLEAAAYVQAHRERIFSDIDENSSNFDVFEYLKTQVLSSSECYDILVELLPPETRNKPSFLLLSNLMNYLYSQFVAFREQELLSITTARIYEVPDLVEFFVQFIIETSRELTTRFLEIPSNTTSDYSTLFQQVIPWSKKDHPFLYIARENLYRQKNEERKIIEILSFDPQKLRARASEPLLICLNSQGFSFDRNWNQITRYDALELLRNVMDLETVPDDENENYVFTFDNVMKMLAIYIRLQFERCPVVIMGSTGCGKTALISYLCETLLRSQLYTLNVHGGTNDKEILEFLIPIIDVARECESSFPPKFVYVFFDEINTSGSLSLFKEILFHRYLNGLPLPLTLRFIAACNPYVFSKAGNENIGLQLNQMENEEKLEYRVRPLPNTMLEVCYDFGSLPDDTEVLYIRSMIMNSLKGNELKGKFNNAIVHCVSLSHRFIRHTAKGTCSLRDVTRFITLYRWFRTTLDSRVNTRYTKEVKMKNSLILALAVCYRSRLTDLREEYNNNMIEGISKAMRMRMSPKVFQNIVAKEETFWVEKMNPGAGIALNEALCENIFMIVVCILNKIPIFVVGKPGTSKSLAVELIASNFNGKSSIEEFFQQFPAIEVFPYQCSPLSTSQGILQTFQRAKDFQEATRESRVVVLLDEVGLAEQSPHLPLKVLHKLLEPPEVAVIGISNWALDLAKMNRAIHLSRPQPGIKDLEDTAMSIVTSKYMGASLHSLARAYFTIYHNQQLKLDFYGLRDFYHLIKYLHRNIQSSITPELLYSAICRNFGGHSGELTRILNEFGVSTSVLGLDYISHPQHDSNNLTTFQEVKNIQENISDENARHLMILTRNNAALHLLFDEGIVSQESVVLFGSDFAGDVNQSDLYLLLHLQQIKTCMSTGKTVVLVHEENLFESLYDMLNQHYTEYGGQRYVRLAMGANNRLCPVHHSFRVIVIVSTEQAYTEMDPPLLNRFEKQLLLKQNLLDSQLSLIHSDLFSWAKSFAVSSQFTLSDAFLGYNEDMIASIVLKLASFLFHRNKEISLQKQRDVIVNAGINLLLWIATPESVIRSRIIPEVPAEEIYFEKQIHSCLPALLDYLFGENVSKSNDIDATRFCVSCESQGFVVHSFILNNKEFEVCDDCYQCAIQEHGESLLSYKQILSSHRNQKTDSEEDDIVGVGEENKLMIIMTFSTFSSCDIPQLVNSCKTLFQCETIRLDEFSSAQELTQRIQEFYSSHNPNFASCVLVVQCNPFMSSQKRISHVRYLMEKESSKFMEKEHKGRKIGILLLSLSRERKDLNQFFSIDFEKYWTFYTVDNIIPAHVHGELEIPELLHGDEIDLLQNIDISITLTRLFRSCLARLNYSIDRTSQDIQEQIEMITKLFQDEKFMKILRIHLFSLMKLDSNISDTSTWQKNLASRPNEIAESGSMRAALFHRLATKVSNSFTYLLSKIDRNRNLSLYGKLEANRELANLWLQLFDKYSQSLHTNAHYVILERYDVVNDANEVSFRCKFPFSFLFCSLVEGLRREISQNDFDQPATLLSLVRTAMPLLDSLELSEYHLELYLQDLLDMQATDASQVLPWRISRFVLLQAISCSDYITSHEHTHILSNIDEPSARSNSSGVIIPPEEHKIFSEASQHEKASFSKIDDIIDTEKSSIRTNQKTKNTTSPQSMEKSSKTKKLQNICYIHVAFWKCEKILHQLSSVLTAIPELEEEILRIVKTAKSAAPSAPSLQSYPASNISFLVAQAIINQCKPCLRLWKSHEQRMKWNRELEKVLPAVENLLENSLHFEWKALLFLREFVYETSHLFSASDDCFGFAELIMKNCTKLRDPDVLENVLTSLRYLCSNDKQGDVTKGCSTVAELYFKDFFFRSTKQDSNHTITDTELEKILDHAIELILNIHQSFNSTQQLQSSKSLRIFIFHQFLSDPDLGNKFCYTLQLHETFKNLTLEAEPCILFTQVSEDLLWEKLLGKSLEIQLLSAMNHLDTITPNSFNSTNKKIPILHAIAISRFSLVLLSNLVQDQVSMENKIAKEFIDKINSLFAAADESRNLKIFFLKTLAKSQGISFVHEFLLCPIRNDIFPWIRQWCEQSYIRQFLDSRFCVNFFSDVPGYSSMVQSIRMALDGNFDSLFDLLHDTQNHQSFVFSLFSEIFIQYSFADVSVGTKEFVDVINTSEYLSKFNNDLVPLIKLLSTNETPKFMKNSKFSETFFTMNTATTTCDIQLYSILVRFYVLHCSGTFGLFSKILIEPESFVDQFLPSMPSDMLETLALVITDAQKWYECPNGHAYYVNNCGRPLEQRDCPACGSPIGGLNHNLVNTNTEKQNIKSNSERSYFIPWQGAENFDFSVTERSLSPLAFRLVRFFIHLVICLRISLTHDIEQDSKLQEFAAPSEIPLESLSDAFVSRLYYDWNQLPTQLDLSMEETTILVHVLITKMINSCNSLPIISNEQERDTWEKMFSKQLINELIIGNSRRELIQKFYEQMNQSESFERELQESLNLDVLSDDIRALWKPILWRHRTIISLDLLRHQFNANNENKTKHPVLHLFIQQEEKLKSLQYLRAAIEWQNILSCYYDRQLSREDARLLTVREVLRELPNEVKWTWEGYKNAWNSFWPFVEQFDCTRIPSTYRSLRLNDDSKIVFSLANECDEGICPFALIQNLIELHNYFLIQLRGDDTFNDSIGYLQSHLLTDSHMIAFDMELDLAPLLCIQSVQSLLYRGGNDVLFLWDRIERQVIDCVLLGKPLIQSRIKKFQFANETENSRLDVLKKFIPQEEIIMLYKEKILSELGSLQAVRLLLDDVDVAIGFLSATCQSFQQIDCKMMLVDYMKNVMRLSVDTVHVFGSKQQSTISQVVQLLHILSLRSLLKEKLSGNSFDKVEACYTKKLSEKQKENLFCMKNNFSSSQLEILLNAWKEFIFLRLCGGYETFSESHSLKNYLAEVQISGHALGLSLADLRWFDSLFTSDLTLAFAVDAFVSLSSQPRGGC